MDSIPCLGCSEFFIPRNRKQQYCSKSKCQRVRKAFWQSQKTKNDPEYRKSQKLSNEKWLSKNPDYWGNYRNKNPKKTDRNRSLQKVRNLRRNKPQPPIKTKMIAKMDARKAPDIKLEGAFWLVPEIAKMDAVKIYLHFIPDSYK